MRLIIFGDLQAGEGAATLFSNPTLPLQRWRVKKFFDTLQNLITTHHCDGTVDLGDLFDDRNSLPLATLDTVLEGIAKIPDSPFNLHLVGNHDTFLKSNTISNSRALQPKFHIIPFVEAIPLDNGWIAIAASFPAKETETANEIERLKRIHRDKKLLLLGHFQVEGCKTRAGIQLNGISKTLLEGFHAGFLGHIHTPQEILPGIHYVGSPFQQNFGESDENKRVAIFDTETGLTQWISMEGFPRYRTMTFDEFQPMTTLGEDRLKVILTTPLESEQFYSHPLASQTEPIYSWNETEVTTTTQKSDWTIEVAMQRYAESNPPSGKGISLDLDTVMALGKDMVQND